jgi:hypothetical protein
VIYESFEINKLDACTPFSELACAWANLGYFVGNFGAMGV